MLKKMKSAFKVISIGLMIVIPSACGIKNTEQSVIPTQQAQSICKSVHKNEDLIPAISAPFITLRYLYRVQMTLKLGCLLYF